MKMESEKEWDVEQFKMEHECDEHWELRRRFLLAHKDQFPEEELVCLAQVFTNIEFLGCRYPEETMQLVAELSQEIAADYREKQKTKLQRTFVKASDAAGAKVKGLNISKPEPSGNKSLAGDGSHINKKIKDNHIRPTQIINKRKKHNSYTNNGPFGNIVIVEHSQNNVISILVDAVNASGQNLEWIYDESITGCKCTIKINHKNLANGHGSNKKLAKRNAATNGLELLKKYYYTIKIKKAFHGTPESIVSTKSLSNAPPVDDILSDDNIGRKLMRLMGWSGNGLGKSQQGIVDPVTVQQQISREGLGFTAGKASQEILRKKFHQILKNYVSGDTSSDLVFLSEFTNEERTLIHLLARQMGVKSHSHGPKNARTLVVSRKIDPAELVEELKEIGGMTEKYELIYPTKAMDIIQ